MRSTFAAVAIVALALFLRLHGVGRDLPSDLEPTNSPALDAFWYLEAAQAPADGSRVEAVPSYDRPLWVAIGRAWFAVAGTGVESTQRLAAVMGSLGVLAVFLALRGTSPRAAVLAALLLATSYPFCGLARTPLIYTPLASLMAVALALHVREEWWARALAWALLLALVGAFKGVAVVAVPGFALSDGARIFARLERRHRTTAILSSAAVLVAAAAGLYAIALIDPGELARNEERIRRYLMPGLGAGSWRPLVLAPFESGLLFLAPGLCGLAAVGATRWRKPVVLAAVGWVATLFLALALLRYRPLRFYSLAGPPLAVLAGVGADALLAGGRRAKRAPLVAGLVVANAWVLICAIHRTPALAPLGAPLGVGAALLVGTGFSPAVRCPSALLGVAVLALTLVLDLTRDLDLRDDPRQVPGTTLVDANRIVREALGPGAVLAGPYASGLAAGARGLERRRATDLTGGPLAAEGIAVAKKGGFTHVALDEDQDARGGLSSGFARLGEPLVLLLEVRVRSQLVLVYRFKNAEATGYRLSSFEAACAAPDAGRALRESGASEALIAARERALARPR